MAPRVEAMVNNRVRGQGSAGELRVCVGGCGEAMSMAGLTGWWAGNHGAPSQEEAAGLGDAWAGRSQWSYFLVQGRGDQSPYRWGRQVERRQA